MRKTVSRLLNGEPYTFAPVKIKQVILLGGIVGLFLACTPRAVQDAQRVVAQADTLRAEGRMYGIDEGDSLTLAQAYETLGAIPLPFREGMGLGSSYAHACFHYGRLLRQKDNPVEAMQVFINATHSHTRDYHILGRIYSNMGDIAHLAGDYQLSYEMYEKSGDMYLKNGDTLLYYYDLNNMAFELAEQGKKEEVLALLKIIENQCSDKNVLAKTWETKANMYESVEQYDSVLLMIEKFPYSAMCYVYKARAFEHLGQIDSALYYAKKMMTLSDASEQNKYNMLYIILNYDTTLVNDDIIALSSQRSDIETDVLIPLHNKWAIAVQLIEQDLNRKPNIVWLYAVCITLFITGLILWIYRHYKRRTHQSLTQQVNELKHINNVAKQEHEQIVQEHTEYQNDLLSQIENACGIFYQSHHLQNDLSWSDYDQMCKIVNQQFFFFAQKLQNSHLLSEREIRLCILVLIGITNSKQLADMLLYSESGIRNFKNRTAKKLDTNSVELRNKLLKIAIGR